MNRLRALFSQVFTISYLEFFAWKLAIFALVFLNLWAFFGDEALPPYGSLFHIWMLFISGHFAGKIATIFNMPTLLGNMIAGILKAHFLTQKQLFSSLYFTGFIYGNLLDLELDKRVTFILRQLALMVILLRAGISLDANAIQKFVAVLFRLSLLPSLLEAIVIAVAAFFVFDLSWSLSLMLGFVVASVSPAIVVPSMIDLTNRQIGTVKGIPTLITASSGVDNSFALSAFYVCFSLAFASQTSLLWTILKPPAELIAGVVIGLAIGLMTWFVPEQCHPYPKTVTGKYNLHRFIILLLCSMFFLFGSKKLNFTSSGPIGILVLSFVASLRWKPFGYAAFCEDGLKKLWDSVLNCYLFVLVTAEIRLKTLESSVLLYGVPILLAALIVRVITAFAVTYGAGFSYKERLFAAIAWIPKASVQAAIGSAALDIAQTESEHKTGILVLTLAVLSILLTGPLGALALDYSARPLLVSADDAADGKHRRKYNKKDYERLDDEEDNSLPLVY